MAAREGRPAPAGYVSLDEYYGVGAGALLLSELRARGMSQAEFATRAGLSTKHVNQVVNGVVPLSTETALRVERVVGLSAPMLASIDAVFQAHQGRTKSRERMARLETWYRGFPLEVLTARGVVTPSLPISERIEQLLAFFGVADDEAFDRVYTGSLLSFRRAQHLTVNAKATATWVRLAEADAAGIADVPYDRDAFEKLLPSLPELSLEPIDRAFPQLQERCARVGVRVVHEPEITGTRVCGASLWMSPDRPLIALTSRYRSEDGFWFNVFHEAGHILLHPRRQSVIELEGDDGDGAEREADEFARDILLRHRAAEVFDRVEGVDDVVPVAEELRVDPGIVAGQVAHATNAWARFAKFRRKLPAHW